MKQEKSLDVILPTTCTQKFDLIMAKNDKQLKTRLVTIITFAVYSTFCIKII